MAEPKSAAALAAEDTKKLLNAASGINAAEAQNEAAKARDAKIAQTLGDNPEKKEVTLKEREELYRDRINAQNKIIDDVKEKNPGGDIMRLWKRCMAILQAVKDMPPEDRVGLRERVGRFFGALADPSGAGLERCRSFCEENQIEPDPRNWKWLPRLSSDDPKSWKTQDDQYVDRQRDQSANRPADDAPKTPRL